MNILTGLLVAFTMALLLTGILFLVIKVDQKTNSKEIKEAEDVKALPKYRIAFHLNNNHITHYSHPIEPYVNTTAILSSEQRAIYILEWSYSRGYFIDIENITYPTSSIKRAYVVKC